MYPKCQRCGSKFDPAFSASRLLCGDCLEVVNGKFTFTEHISPDAPIETIKALGELLTLAAVQAEKGNLTPDAADASPVELCEHGNKMRECFVKGCRFNWYGERR